MKKIFSAFLVALFAAGMTTAAFADEQVSDEFHFYGELIDTGVQNVAPFGLENAVIGTVMGAGETPEGNEIIKAFDGDIDTFWAATANAWATHMIVLKADEPVTPAAFIVTTQTRGDGNPIRFHALNGSLVQGSNDGVNWETLYILGEYEYIDWSELAGEGAKYYTLVPEEEMGAYTYFRYVNNDDGAAALAEFAVLTEVPEDDGSIERISDEFNYYEEIIDTGVKNVVPFGLENVAIGTVMGAGETFEGYEIEKAFDNNIDTFWQATSNCWATHFITLKFDEPITPAGFVLSTQTNEPGIPTRFHAIYHSIVQGSNDGVKWKTLYYIEDDYIWYAEDYEETGVPYYIAAFEGDVDSYTYIRYANNNDGASALSEFAVLTALPGEGDAAEEQVSDLNHYYGEIVDTGEKNVVPYGLENVVIGTIMGAGETTEGNEYAKAFDNNIDTWWSATANNWATHALILKADAPVKPAAFVVSTTSDGAGNMKRPHIIFHSYVQGSNDGVNWDDLYYFEDDYIWYDEDYQETGVPYYVAIAAEDCGEYTYFRYVNNDDGAAQLSEFAVLTALPGTDVDAPSDDQSEAPQTFDAGIIAAAVATVAAAGYAIARKRK